MHLAEKHQCKACESYAEILEDDSVDIITIAIPSGLHYQPVIDDAGAGKHVICEKPLEIDLNRIDQMIAAHAKAGTYLGCMFQNRFREAMVPLKQARSWTADLERSRSRVSLSHGGEKRTITRIPGTGPETLMEAGP
jgi:predicted dehydrogenase